MKLKFYSGIIFLTSILLFGEKANAQSWLWAKSLEYIGYGTSAVDLASGAVYTTGYFTGTLDFDPGPGVYNVTAIGAIDVYISKLDSSGNLVWAKSYGVGSFVLQETYYETYYYGHSIAVDPTSGDVYAAGGFWSTYPMAPGMFILKLDSAGDLVWMRELGADPGWSDIAIDEVNGDVYTTGGFQGTVEFDPWGGGFILTSSGSSDIFISKLNSSGNFVWAKAMGGTGNDWGISITLDSGEFGNVYTTGSFEGIADMDPGTGTFNLTAGGSQDIYISKLDLSGNFVWAKAMGGMNNDFGQSVVVDGTGSGSVYSTGYFEGTVDFDPGGGIFNLTSSGEQDIYISKLDDSGNFVWAKAIGGTGWDTGNSIAIDLGGSGDVYTTGRFTGTVDFDPGAEIHHLTSAGQTDVFLSKLDSSGDFLWVETAGGTGPDDVYSVATDASGNVNVTGVFGSPSITFGTTTLPGNGSWNVFMTKLDGTTLPCTGIVTNTNDSGLGSLRQNISCASSGDTITFSLAPLSQITLTSGEIVVGKSLVLDGPGMPNLTISGNHTSRIFHVLPGKNLDLENMSLKNATSITNGGAVFVEGNLTLRNVLLQSNFENGSPKGMTLKSPGQVTIIGNVDIEN